MAAQPPEQYRPNHSLSRRQIWMSTRAVLETNPYKNKPPGTRSRRRWSFFDRNVQAMARFLKATGLYARGVRNAKRIVLNRHDVYFEGLPRGFDGYRILHLTDLHLDFIRRTAHRVRKAIAPLEYELCLLSGDYRHGTRGGFKRILAPLDHLAAGLEAPDGVWATLGNHDTYLMVEAFKHAGIPVLANETITLQRNGFNIHLTGVDDPHYYYTDQAIAALEQSPPGFKIALIHTPELYLQAARNGYNLYLCGHTHGGQISLPGGIPVVTHLYAGRRYYRGWWRNGKMQGYTNQGCGAVTLPIRFNTESEVALITLRRGVAPNFNFVRKGKLWRKHKKNRIN